MQPCLYQVSLRTPNSALTLRGGVRLILHTTRTCLYQDFSFTPYATISYIKLGPKADLLKNEKHKIMMQMKKFTSVDPVKSSMDSKTQSAHTSVQEGGGGGGGINSAGIKKDGGQRKRSLPADAGNPRKSRK
ncbi:UNVERIFIED_CONTAM: hypothetical protein FKN15_005264 [Acipenser sinensis]